MRLILAFKFNKEEIKDSNLISERYQDFITSIRQLSPNIIFTALEENDEVELSLVSKSKEGEHKSLIKEL